MSDGINEDLDWVLASQKEDELESLLDNSDCHLLFTVVSCTGGHKHASETFNKRALGLLEPSLLVAASSVWDVDLLFNALD